MNGTGWMGCPLEKEETRDLLLEYSAQRLDAARTTMLELHMQSCAECARFRRDQAVVWDALDTWEPMPISTDFNRRLWQRIDRAAKAPWYRGLADSLRFVNWKPALPVAAAILAIAGGFLLDRPDNKVTVPPVDAVQGVSVMDADQLEQTLDDIQMLHQLDSTSVPNGPGAKEL